MEKNKRLYRSRIVNPVSPVEAVEWKDGALAVDENGTIVSCGEYNLVKKSVKDDFTEENLKDYLIIPGLIDCHLHMPQLDQRGKHGSTLLDWLEKYIYPAEKAFENLDIVEDVAKRFFKKLILNGVTTSSVYVTIHEDATNLAFEIGKTTGLRLFMGKVMMDQNAPEGLAESTDESIEKSIALHEKWDGKGDGKLRYVFTPRFGPTCSVNLWKHLGKILTEKSAYMQTHISETNGEVERVRKLFPKYKNYADLMGSNGCLTQKTLLAHAIYVSKEECKMIAKEGAKIVHCPTSNLFLKSGRMPVEIIEGTGITYGLGTDIGAGTSMSLFTVMRHADFVQPGIEVTPIKAFYLATLGGARVLQMGDALGNFEVNKKADFCLVDISRIDPRYNLDDLTLDEVLSLMMYRGDGNTIVGTYVDGVKLDVDSIVLKNR